MNKSLNEEYISEPETGAKLSLEQAQSGYWVKHNNEFATVSEADIEKMHTEKEKIIQRGINYLKSSKNYLSIKIDDSEILQLEKLITLKKYSDWYSSNSYKYIDENKILIIINIYDDGYTEPVLFFCLNLNFDAGHYYFSPKTRVEKILDIIKSDNQIKLKEFKCNTYRKTKFNVRLINLLKKIDEKRDIEFELLDNKLYIKNCKLLTENEVKIMEKILKKIC